MMKKNVNIGYLVFLSFVAALGGFLFGYDTAVISGTIAQVTVLFHLDTLQQGWYVGCALIGSIVGVLFAGVLSDKFGRKLTMVLSAVLFSTSAIGCAICANFDELVVYRIIGGVGIGVVSIIYLRSFCGPIQRTFSLFVPIGRYSRIFGRLFGKFPVAWIFRKSCRFWYRFI